MPQIHCTVCLCDNPVSKHEVGTEEKGSAEMYLLLLGVNFDLLSCS